MTKEDETKETKKSGPEIGDKRTKIGLLFGHKEKYTEDGWKMVKGSEAISIRRVALWVAIIVVVALVLGTMLVKVPAGEKAVVVGGFNIGHQFDEGWHLKHPLDTVEKIRYNTQEMSYVGADYAEDSTGSIMAITSDNAQVYIDMTLVYHIDPEYVAELRVENGPDWKQVIVDPIARSIPRDVAAQYSVYEIAGIQRASLGVDIEDGLIGALAEKHIVLESFSMRDIRLPTSIIGAVEAKKVAEQQILTEEYNLEAERFRAEQDVVNAQAQYNVTIIQATAREQAIDIVMQQFNATDGSVNESDMISNYLMWLYIQELSDPDSNIQYILLPTEGSMPLLLDVTGAPPTSGGA